MEKLRDGCLWVFSYIKPQLNVVRLAERLVVYGSFPTSNHNGLPTLRFRLPVVYGSFPTSNHNVRYPYLAAYRLFMGLFLHQTTTYTDYWDARDGCLWVFSYIKPQLNGRTVFPCKVVYGSFPTSNHNYRTKHEADRRLFMGLFLHQTTTVVNPARR